MFSKRDQRAIFAKLRHIAENLPSSLRLRTVNRLLGAILSEEGAEAYELRVGSGYRAAFVLFHARQLMLVYMVGTHDYANRNFLSGLSRVTQ